MREKITKKDLMEVIQTSRDALGDSMTLSEEDYEPQLTKLEEIIQQKPTVKKEDVQKIINEICPDNITAETLLKWINSKMKIVDCVA